MRYLLLSVITLCLVGIAQGYEPPKDIPPEPGRKTEVKPETKDPIAVITLKVEGQEEITLVEGPMSGVAPFIIRIQELMDCFQWRRLKASMNPPSSSPQEKPAGPIQPPPEEKPKRAENPTEDFLPVLPGPVE